MRRGNLGVNTDTANMISATLAVAAALQRVPRGVPGARPQSADRDRRADRPPRADAFAAQLLAELRREPDRYRSISAAGRGRVLRAQRPPLSAARRARAARRSARRRAAAARVCCKARFDGAAVLDVATRTLDAGADGGAGDAAALAPFYAELARALDGARAGDAGAARVEQRCSRAGAAPTHAAHRRAAARARLRADATRDDGDRRDSRRSSRA